MDRPIKSGDNETKGRIRADAPSTMLRMVPLPRCAGEEKTPHPAAPSTDSVPRCSGRAWG
jgi:hypothetical protein